MEYVPCSALQPSEPPHVPSGRNTSTGSSGRDALSDLSSAIWTGRHVPDTLCAVGGSGAAVVAAGVCPPATGGCDRLVARTGQAEAHDGDGGDRDGGRSGDDPGTALGLARARGRPLGQAGGLRHRGRGTVEGSPQVILEIGVAHDNLSSNTLDLPGLPNVASALLAVARTEDGLMPSMSAIVRSSRSW